MVSVQLPFMMYKYTINTARGEVTAIRFAKDIMLTDPHTAVGWKLELEIPRIKSTHSQQMPVKECLRHSLTSTYNTLLQYASACTWTQKIKYTQ